MHLIGQWSLMLTVEPVEVKTKSLYCLLLLTLQLSIQNSTICTNYTKKPCSILQLFIVNRNGYTEKMFLA